MGGSRATPVERSLGGEVMMKKDLKYFPRNWWLWKKVLKTAWFIGLASMHILLDRVANSIFSEMNLRDQISSLSYCNNVKKK